MFADHQADPQKGRAEAERLITQEKVSAIIGTYQSAVAVTVSQICERYQIPFVSADNSSPSLHRRGLKYYFRAAPHDEMYSAAMFDFFDALKKKGTKIETLSLFHEDTIFGTDSGNAQAKIAGERGYKIVTDIKYRANSPSLSAEVQQLKSANRRRADAVELHHRRHPAGQDHGRARLQAECDRGPGRRLLGEGAL
ncbi:ABC-type branched-subunit amino acid transport system substrate-binding protein [Bradyrhizobium sp. LM6.10]